MRRTWLTGAASCLLLVLTACSAVAHEPGQAAPAGASPGASTSGSASPSASGAVNAPRSDSTNTSTPGTNAQNGAEIVAMPASGGHFQSPSGNIVCEVYYQFNGITHAYCQTETPANSVSMDSTGTYKVCTGTQCLGNSGEGTITLAYGKAIAVGPFRCESASTGVVCTVTGGKGFRISNSGITSAT